MSRLAYFRSNPKRTLTALTGVLAASAVAVGSGADFTASSANPGNTFTAGTLTMSNSKADAVVLTASNLKPGGAAQTGQVDIGNTGSLGATLSLAKSSLVDRNAANETDATTPISAKLNVKVVDCGLHADGAPTCDATDPVEYSGPLSSFGTTDLGDYAAGAKHRYEFSVSLDGSAGNDHQGDSASVQFDWSAAQN